MAHLDTPYAVFVYILWSTQLKQTVAMQSPTQQERQAALFNSTAVHASFGDVELAQITLRGMPLVTLSIDAIFKADDVTCVSLKGFHALMSLLLLLRFCACLQRVSAMGWTSKKP